MSDEQRLILRRTGHIRTEIEIPDSSTHKASRVIHHTTYMLAVRIRTCAEQELDIGLPMVLDGSKKRRVIETVDDAVHECIWAIARGKGVVGVGVVERGLSLAVREKVTEDEGIGVGGSFNGGEIMAVNSRVEVGILKDV